LATRAKHLILARELTGVSIPVDDGRSVVPGRSTTPSPAPAATPVPAAAPASVPATSVAPARDPNYPDFFFNPPQTEDAIYGIGSAKLADSSMSRTTADSRARQDLAFQLKTAVQSMITDYAREAGTADNPTTLQLAEVVGRQLTEAELRNVSIQERWVAPDGTIWTLVVLKKADAKQQTAEIFESEASKYAEWKTANALENMDSELSKTQSSPVTQVPASTSVLAGLTYEVVNERTVEITSYTGSAAMVVIPATIADKPVTAIGER
jgi:hypothetical protein